MSKSQNIKTPGLTPFARLRKVDPQIADACVAHAIDTWANTPECLSFDKKDAIVFLDAMDDESLTDFELAAEAKVCGIED